MRIIAGSRRSLKLVTPEGLGTRPTQDRIKETLFNVIQNDVPGSVFIDLFAGSGGIGLEALSRGAKRAYLVDNSRDCEKCIKKNIETTKFADEAVYLKSDVMFALSAQIHDKADIIFMDPPYGEGLEVQVLSFLAADRKLVSEDTLFIVEASLETELGAESLGYEIIKVKKYKSNQHYFLKLK